MKIGRRILSSGALLSLALISCLGPAGAADKPTVTLGLVAYLSEFWPALVAQKMGYFDEAGISVDIVTTGASSKSVQMASLGAIHIGSSGVIDPVRAMDGGVMGVYSASDGEPLRSVGTELGSVTLPAARKYSEWKFTPKVAQ